MARVGLVLGAGGIAGGSWHAGVLAALADVTGWDARDAEVVVGTSAGSVAGATVRAGISATDLYAAATDGPLSAEGSRLLGRVRTDAGFTRVPRAGRWRPANPLLLRSLASLDPRPFVALAGMLPAGEVDASSIGDRIERLAGGSAWPAKDLWIVAVGLADGNRVVFGRDVVPVDGIGAAVTASCAIPGWFAPVRVDGRRYVDGGVHSTTNADVVGDLGLDAVIISAPMAGAWRSLRRNATAVSRASARIALDREVTALRRTGMPVLVFQPGPADTPMMDGRAMDMSARVPVARRARESALAALGRASSASVRELLVAARA